MYYSPFLLLCSDSGYRGSDRDTDYTVVPSLETAAHDAAVADGLINNNAAKNSESKVKKAGLRRGKWTTEEELYANRLIQEFKSGLLPLTDGTTLRTFLSKLLNCDPMRISKKFVGQNCIGKVSCPRPFECVSSDPGVTVETSLALLGLLHSLY